jgi:hypothetical protein
MTTTWLELEGLPLAKSLWLKARLSAGNADAWYLATFHGRPSAVRIMPAADASAAAQLADWCAARQLEHPNLVRLLDCGRAEAEGADVIYAACEYPDDFLAATLAERPLSAAEASEVLAASVSALAYLHARGLALGAVKADRIVAIGDGIKLPSDAISPGGAIGPANDLWSLGAMLVEILTRERPVSGKSIAYLPEPFATVVERTLRDDPAERWPAAEIEAWLSPAAPEAVPAPVPVPVPDAFTGDASAAAPAPALEPPAHAPEHQAEKHQAQEHQAEMEPPPEPAPVRHGGVMKWVPLAGVVAAAGLGLIFLPYLRTPAKAPAANSPASAVAPTGATPATPPATSAGPPPRTAAHNAPAWRPDAVWRVVVYEYSHRAGAEQRARTLNRQRPAWHAQVFTPRGNRAPYLVALGGPMTRPEAERLRNQARAAGLPRDTFIRNYPR